MYCKKCGFMLKEGDRFCTNCGEDNSNIINNNSINNQNNDEVVVAPINVIPDNDKVEVAPVNVNQNIVNDQNNFNQGTIQNNMPYMNNNQNNNMPYMNNNQNNNMSYMNNNQYQPNNNKKDNTALYIILGVVAILIVIGLVISIVFKQASNEEQDDINNDSLNNSENINNDNNSNYNNSYNNSSTLTNTRVETFSNYKFDVPTDYQTNIENDMLYIYDSSKSWYGFIQVLELDYDIAKTHFSTIKTTLEEEGMKVVNHSTKYYDGKEYVIFEVTQENIKLIMGLYKINSKDAIMFAVGNTSNTFDYSLVEKFTPIVSSVR